MTMLITFMLILPPTTRVAHITPYYELHATKVILFVFDY